MPRSLPRLLLLGLLLAAWGAPVRGEKLTRAEVARRGKAITALVQVQPGVVAGTAFAVHKGGYFVTAERLIPEGAAGAGVTVVLDAGLERQKVGKARLVRRDRESGLALLRVAGIEGLPAVPLGDTGQLTELAELVVLGYPGGARVNPAVPEYPALGVDVGTVTSLARARGELTGVALKGVAAPRAVGGPLLAEDGSIVGVVLSSAGGVTRAVPVNRLVALLLTPELEVTAPVLTRDNQHQPVTFEARVTSVLAPPAPLSVELVLRAGDEPERRVAMTRAGEVYRATTRAVPTGGERLLTLTARFDAGMVSGQVADRELTVGARKVRLADCKRYQARPTPTLHLGDGKSVAGEVAGLEKVPLVVGGQTVTLDLTRANSLEVLAPAPVAVVECTVVARAGGKVLGQQDLRLPVGGVDLVQPADLTGPGIVPPALPGGRVTRMLPEIASDVRVGGGGRYLVFHLPRMKKLAIFDLNEAALTRYIPLAEDRAVYAAGLDKVVVGLTKSGVLERWDLGTATRELARNVPGGADVESVLLGSSSRGPVAVNGQFFDLNTLAPLPIRVAGGGPAPYSPVSADGTVYGAWKPNQSPAESTTFVLEGDELKRYNEGGVGHVVPGPDGRAVYTAHGVRTAQLKGLQGSPVKPTYCIPATEGDFYLALTPAERDKGGSLAVYLLGNDQPLVKDLGIAHGVHFDGWDRQFFGPWKRIFLVPRARALAIFPESNDRVEVHRFDLDDALEKSGRDYLLITSRPPARARRGAEFTYQLEVKSRKGGVTYKLAAGPEGMTVSPAGLVKWAVPADSKLPAAEVLVTVRDGADQEAFHPFSLRLADR